MPTIGLPPPPINDAPGSFTWLEWYRQLRSYISTSGSVPWYVINFAGSNINDIQDRDHNELQNLQGGKVNERYHLTAAQASALTAGEHNQLAGLQGGNLTERFHIDENTYNDLVTTGYLPLTGGTLTGPLYTQGAQGEVGVIEMVPDPSTPGSDVMVVGSEDGVALTAPYILIDTDSPILTMPGPQVGSMVVVAGIGVNGGAFLGYQAQQEPGYSIQDTTTTPVVIKAAGTTPITPWVQLGLTVVLTEDIPVGTGTTMFDMILSNPTNRSGVVEFGFNLNGVNLGRDITQAIPANYNSTIAVSLPLVNGYSSGDDIRLIARVTSNSNDAFSLTMAASPTDIAVFRVYTTVGGGVVASDIPPVMDGTANAGLLDSYSRGDHVHPSDTSRAPATHVGATGTAHGIVTTSVNGFMVASDKLKLDGIAVGAQPGTVTSIATSGAITGGTITTTGTITHLTTDGFLHVPATSTTNSGKVLTAGATAGSISWQTPTGGGGTAASVSFVPYLTINSTNVQAAIQELKDELDTLKSQLYAYG